MLIVVPPPFVGGSSNSLNTFREMTFRVTYREVISDQSDVTSDEVKLDVRPKMAIWQKYAGRVRDHFMIHRGVLVFTMFPIDEDIGTDKNMLLVCNSDRL